MPEHLLISPDLELLKEYQKAADGNIRYITVSPEVKGVPESIKGMIDLGMKVAIGHSGADYETAWKCINEGAVSATHTFNAMKLLHQHFPAIMGLFWNLTSIVKLSVTDGICIREPFVFF